ncbi:U2 small nuclear ribonucleoprotein B [Gracilaria domingensis]|nr:U2 small nuclear ribonucleoprotein B [Gracilaria domingensis]
MDAPAPCRTLYVRNLPDKLKKVRLRRLLHAAFSPYGQIVHIVAEKSLALRGQAFITFHTQTSATAALRKLHSTEFMGKQISVSYARSLSDKAGSDKLGGDSKLTRKKRAAKRRADQQAAKRAGVEAAANAAATQPPANVGAAAPEPPPMAMPAVPNRILFAQNLPRLVEQEGKKVSLVDALSDLFARFAGFVEVRSVPGNDTIAFVEFGNEAEAAVALSGLQQHPLGTPAQPITLSFANK